MSVCLMDKNACFSGPGPSPLELQDNLVFKGSQTSKARKQCVLQDQEEKVNVAECDMPYPYRVANWFKYIVF